MTLTLWRAMKARMRAMRRKRVVFVVGAGGDTYPMEGNEGENEGDEKEEGSTNSDADDHWQSL